MSEQPVSTTTGTPAGDPLPLGYHGFDRSAERERRTNRRWDAVMFVLGVLISLAALILSAPVVFHSRSLLVAISPFVALFLVGGVNVFRRGMRAFGTAICLSSLGMLLLVVRILSR